MLLIKRDAHNHWFFPAGFADDAVIVFSGPVFRHRSGRWLASAECQDGARYFGVEVRKAGSDQDLLHLRKFEYMKAVIPETPLTYIAKFQDTQIGRASCR